jgi:hypothetical protein
MQDHQGPELCLGKAPATPERYPLKFATYLDSALLPSPPASFGHEELVHDTEWGMLGNGQEGHLRGWGCCVWSGAAHEHMMWSREGGHPAAFSRDTVLSDYGAATGFNPSKPSTDKGSNVVDAANYRLHTGIVDVTGNRHKIYAFLSLRAGDWNQLMTAIYLFGAVGIGFNVSSANMHQFANKTPWDYVMGSPSVGGHYVPGLAHRGNLVVVSWGRFVPCRRPWYENQSDEAVVYLTEEMLLGGKSPEGFNRAQLLADLGILWTAGGLGQGPSS